MSFSVIDQKHWDRKEYFEHYYSQVPCTYSVDVKIDITPIRKKNLKLYPAMLYYLTTVINRHAEFRTAINDKGELGIYSEMLPSYTIFHADTETFSNLWTKYDPDFEKFLASYQKDLEKYGSVKGMAPKPDVPPNHFCVSMIPWVTFEGFHLNIKEEYEYLLPIFTMGRFYEKDNKTFLPLSIQVHHAVCDGFHVCRFIRELQDMIDG